MLDYNVPGGEMDLTWLVYNIWVKSKNTLNLQPIVFDMVGKCNRGLSVVDSYKLLKGTNVLSQEDMFLASTLGWCVEWVML